ncbi:MAG TPA: TetR family transcriptional regulator [Lacisediminihabitans sp.]|jgi:AcrR family transcriptional regulator|nr:TetR family transcriptional regulator [Lacisediminihabitans sp.]HXD62585.1 TetR family transcriptional regulator [Lacisediminihabitans sp.]
MARSTPAERHRPRQDRSTQRVELILDTTAALIDELGYGALTTALIARRAGMSGPAIYRYFTDIDSIALALASRNLERYVERCREFLASTVEWQNAIVAAIGTYADFFRHEPGFRRVRLGDTFAQDARGARSSNKGVLARAVSELFVEKFEVLPRTELVLHVEVMVEIGECLIARAFDSAPDGDPFFLGECERVMVNYLDEYLARPIS